MRVIAKKRCRAMVEPPEKGERATLNPNLSTRLNLLFSIRPLGGGLALLVEEGERRCLAVLRGRKTDRGWLYPLGIALRTHRSEKMFAHDSDFTSSARVATLLPN